MKDKPQKTLSLRYCQKDKVCFRRASSSFNQYPFCRFYNSTQNSNSKHYLKKTKKSCKPIYPNLYHEFCKSRDYLAVKIIRLKDLEQIRPVVEAINKNFYILYVIRDPRGLVYSRQKMGYSKWSRDS